MSLPYRSTPLKDIAELQGYYGQETPTDQIPYVQRLNEAIDCLSGVIKSSDYNSTGMVFTIEGTWGSGKTSMVTFLCHELAKHETAIVKYDSLYYGNVSEATDIFIKAIFEEIKERFGIKLSNAGGIAKNITPRFELSNGLPKLALDYKLERSPTEIIKKRLENQLLKLPGKMIVVIDDLDRVSSKDVVHFLRLVRVLRELPNFIVILPLDRYALEELLKTEGIGSPRRYLEKIIDKSIDINPEQGSSKDLFARLMAKKHSELQIGQDLSNTMWDLYLWEISLGVIKTFETQNGQRINLNVGSTDPQWQLLEPVQSKTGDNLVREFYKLTNTAYGSDINYVYRVNNSIDPSEGIFQHYTQVYANMTFTDLLYGRYFPNLSPGLSIDNTGQDTFTTMRWWNDRESIMNIQSSGDKTQKTDYRVDIPADETQRNNYFTDINGKAHYVWDVVRSLASAYLPERAIQYMAPRTLNRVVDNVDIDLEQFQSVNRAEDYAELHRSIRRAVQKVIFFSD